MAAESLQLHDVGVCSHSFSLRFFLVPNVKRITFEKNFIFIFKTLSDRKNDAITRVLLFSSLMICCNTIDEALVNTKTN